MLGRYFHENREICLKIISSYSNQLRALNNYLVTKKPDKENESPVKLLDAGQIKHLKRGTNVLAAYGNVEYDRKTHEPAGQMDLFIEGLKMSDLK